MITTEESTYSLPLERFEHDGLAITLGVVSHRRYCDVGSSYDLDVHIYHGSMLSSLQFKGIEADYRRGTHTDNDICYYLVKGHWESFLRPSDPLPKYLHNAYIEGIRTYKEIMLNNYASHNGPEWRLGEYDDGERFLRYCGDLYEPTGTSYSADLIGAIMDQFEAIITGGV